MTTPGRPPDPRPRAARARRAAGHAARVILGLIFVMAGLLKAIDPAEFARQMAGYGLIGAGASRLASPLLIALELTLGIALLVGFRPRPSAIVAAALLALFIAIEAHGISQGRTEACGCFGAYVQRTPGQVIVEDLIFIGLALLSLWGLRSWGGAPRRPAALAVFAGGVLSLALAAASPHLPIDSLITSLRPGASVADLGLAGAVPELETGRRLVALIDVTDEAAVDVAARLDAIATRPGAPDVIALTPATEEERLAFTWTAVPEFDLVNVDRPVLKRLYRSLPRFFLVVDGRVGAIWDGAVPDPDDLLSSEAS